jgi:hypothetical protein
MSADSNGTQEQPNQDFRAALHEIHSNLEVRRLMFVLSNILVPACAVALTDCLTGNHYPEAIQWLPEHILAVVGAILSIAGVLVTGILARCHFGLVVNGSKMAAVQQQSSDGFRASSLNWLGVTTNFVALTALSGGAGLGLLLASFGWGVGAAVASLLFAGLLMLSLQWNHSRANRLCAKLAPTWQSGPVDLELREQHVRQSLEATTSDISVIVIMAVALFTGLFNSMTNLGGLSPQLTLTPSVETLKDYGIVALSAFALASLLLSSRMVLRLRIALAEHAQRLAELRHEPDNPWAFNVQERSFLLFSLLQLLAATSVMILVWTLAGPKLALAAAGALLLAGLTWYPIRLAGAARRALRQN